MTQVEKRVLELQFDNKNFEKNVQTSMRMLSSFQSVIDGAGKSSNKFSLKGMISALTSATKKFNVFKTSAQKDIADVQSSSDKFNMQSVAANLESIASRFTNLGIIGMSVLQDLTRRAIDFGITMAKSVLDPIVEGGKKRAFNIENARFTLQGLFKDEEKVDEIMKRAMASVDGTAYGFDQAALAASQFAASGMDMNQLSTTLNALAGTSAVFNAEYENMSRIFTTMASNGRVMGDQLIQLSTYGIPLKSILTDSFNSVLEGSSELSEGMQQNIRDIIQYGRENITGFTSDLSHITEEDLGKLVSAGVISFDMFSAIMADSFGDQAKKANETFTGSMSNIRAALARTGALFFRFDNEIGIIRQNGELVQFLNQIIEFINKFNKYLEPFAKSFTEAFNSITGSVVEALQGGALENIFVGITTILSSLGETLKYIAFAFRDVFNLKDFDLTSKIKELALGFREWAESIKPTTKQLTEIKRVAAGVFAAFKILWQIFLAVVDVVKRLIIALKPLWKVIGQAVLSFSDWLVGVSEFIEETSVLTAVVEGLGRAFDVLGLILGFVAETIRDFFKYIVNAAKGLDVFDNFTEKTSNKVKELLNSNESFNKSLDKLKEKLNGLKGIFGRIAEKMSEFGQSISSAFSNALLSGDFSALLMVVNQGLFGGLLVAFISFLNKLKKPIDEFGGILQTIKDIPKNLSGGLDSIFGSFKKGQDSIDPNAILKIAISIGVLALALMLIGSLDLEHMAVGLGGLAGVMAEMIGFLKVLPKLTEGMKRIDRKNLQAVSLDLILLAIAIYIMASAMKKLGEMDYEETVRGLVGLAGAVGMLVLAAKSMGKISGSLRGVAGPLILFAIAIALLVIPIKALSKLNYDELARGLIGVGGAVAALAIMAKALNDAKLRPSTALSLILIAAALAIMAGPVTKLAGLDWEQLAKGLSGVAAMLAMVAGFTRIIKPDKMFAVALSMVLVGAALEIFTNVAQKLSGMPYEKLAVGLGAMALILAEVAIFTRVINPDKILLISAAMVILGLAMEIFTDVISKLGGMPLQQLMTGLITIAAALIMFGLACEAMENNMRGAVVIGILAASLVPLAFALGLLAAIPIPGLVAALAAIAATLLIFGIAAKVLGGAIGIMLALAAVFLLLGVACLALGVGIGVAAWGIAMLVTAIATGGAVLVATIMSLIQLLPMFFENLAKGIVAFFQGIADSWTSFKDSLITIARGLIDIFVTIIPEAVNAVLQFILAIVQALVENIPTIVDALLQLITGVLQAIADNIQPIVEAGLSIATNFINGVAEGIGPLIDAAFNLVIQFIDGLATAIDNNHNALYDACAHLIESIVNAIKDLAIRMFEGAQALWDKFKEKWEEFKEKAKELGKKIVNGFIDGIKSMGQAVWDAASNLATEAWNGFCSWLGISSPSSQFQYAGEMCVEGLKNGLNGASDLTGIVQGVANGLIEAFNASSDMTAAGGALADGVVNGFNSRKGNIIAAANTQTNAFLNGIKSKSKAAITAGTVLANSAATGIKNASASFSSAGSSAANAYANGISGAASRVSSAAASLGRAASSGASTSLYSAGVDAGNGFANGLRATIGRVRDAAGSIASVAAVKIRLFLGIGSPSKLFHQYGVWSGEGLANGFTDSIPDITQSAEEVGRASFEALSDSLAKLSTIDYDLLDIDAEPTITPIIDMTNVNAAKSQLNDVFSQQRVMLGTLDSMAQSIAYSFSGSREPMVTQTVNQPNSISDTTSANDIYNKIAGALNEHDELTAEEVKGLREDVKNMKIYLDSGQLVGGLVANSRRRAAMNV